ncbi:MAG: hypothetical protein ACR652_09765 [Methylocystis sp.]|uniref:hypothetical protein n=1 Tax=Methylocystis sp. TaxID=1911079 RepID=UPI003DA2E53E
MTDPCRAEAIAILPPLDADVAAAIAIIHAAAAEMTDSGRESLRDSIDAALRAARAARMDRRDALIRELIETRYRGALHGRCMRLAADWVAHVTRGVDDPALSQITRLNDGRAIGHKQVRNIAEGHRNQSF